MTFSGIPYLANKKKQIQFTTSVSIIMREFEGMHCHFLTLKGIEIISSLKGSWSKATKKIFSEKKMTKMEHWEIVTKGTRTGSWMPSPSSSEKHKVICKYILM